MVVGASGSGKSTVAAAIAARIGAEHVELDALFWRPHWVGAPDDEFAAAVDAAAFRNTWVIDGNYWRASAPRLARADTLVWVDTSLPRTAWRSVIRALSRARSGRELWPGTGNRETMRRAFASRDSIILYTLTHFRAYRRRYEALAADASHGSHPGLTVVRLRTPREARAYLASIGPR